MSKVYRLGPARRAVNVAVTAMVTVGVGARSTYLLTTVGRKSGEPRTTPVALVERHGQRWLVSPYGEVGWVLNARATPQVTLTRGRAAQTVHAQELGAQDAGPVLQQYLRQGRITRPFFDAEVEDPPAAFVAEAGRHPVFELTAPAPGSGTSPGGQGR